MTPAQKRTETTKRNKEMDARIAIEQAKTRDIVASGKCPYCGRKLARNLSMKGWWQCTQFGAVGFKADPTQASCSWQGFTN